MDISRAEEVSGLLRQLAHSQRLLILCALSEGPKTVSELVRCCGASQSASSQFLLRMKAEGILSSQKEGLYVRYKIANPEVKKVIKAFYTIFCK